MGDIALFNGHCSVPLACMVKGRRLHEACIIINLAFSWCMYPCDCARAHVRSLAAERELVFFRRDKQYVW